MATYNSWTIISYPTLTTQLGTPLVPASIEVQHIAIVGVTTSPFSGQQQITNWNAAYKELSVSYSSMSLANGQAMAAWIESLNGPANVFTFPTSLCTIFPNELTTDGSTARYFRLKGNPKWDIKTGQIYSCTFELREAI